MHNISDSSKHRRIESDDDDHVEFEVILQLLICDQIWENPPYGIFRENRDRNIYQ